MPKDVYYGKTLRKSFARVEEIRDMPNLLEIQKSSYKWFLETGLREVFRDVDSVTDYSGNLELSFIDYSMDEKPKYNEEECKARDATYAKPLKVRVRLRNKETEEIKEQEIFMGDFPIMTDGGTFVINGAERVIVSQIVRSPGVYFDKTTDKAMISVYASTVIPYHGAWLEYETDANDVFNVRIDKNRKLPITWFLKAMGAFNADKPATWLSCVSDPFVGAVTNERIKEIFGEDERIIATLEKDSKDSREGGRSRDESLIEIYRKLRPGDPPTVESSEALLDGRFTDFLLSEKWNADAPDYWADRRECLIRLSLPKFDVSSDTDLIPGMKAMGITDVFDYTISDFTPLTRDSDELSVSEAKHAARVKVDEDGVEAAAFTLIAVKETAMIIDDEVDFVLDRPFLFAVTGEDGLPLFVDSTTATPYLVLTSIPGTISTP